MKKIGLCGHYAFGKKILDGQTIKTKIVTKELMKYYTTEQIKILDTYGGKFKLIVLMIKLIFLMKVCKNIIIFPGKNGLRVFAPLIAIINKFFNRNLNYVVIGGWLPEFLENRNYLRKALEKFNYIYVETDIMKKKLEQIGLKNVVVMPNCKELNILSEDKLIYNNELPLRVCTFSRVLKEKGIEDAINAVIQINEKYKKTVYSLDIYGQIEMNYKESFEKLQKMFPEFIEYKGLVEFDKSTEVLKNYFLLLFPTYYSGEGFAGTVLDAYSAGVPVLASDWRYNTEVILNNRTGLIFKNKNIEDLIDKLDKCYKDKETINSMKSNCLLEAKKYQPSKVVKILLRNITLKKGVKK